MMPSHKLDFPDMRAHRVERTLSQLSDILSSLRLQANAGPSRTSSSDVGRRTRAMTGGNTGALTGLTDRSAGPTETRTEESSDIEDLVKGLLALADSAESDFERLGVVEYIDDAIEYRSQALSFTHEGHDQKPNRLAALGSSLYLRFRHLGKLADINKAIEYQNQAMLLTPDGHSEELVRLNSLASSYHSRFGRSDEQADLDKAIEYLNRAVVLVSDGHPEELTLLNNLGIIYWCRFERLGALVDLDNAMRCQTRAVLLSPDGHTQKPARLSSLGKSYHSRFKRLGELADLNQAIDYKNQAVLLTSDGHSDKPNRLDSLGISYQSRFERLGRPADLDKALECKSQAVLLIPEDHVARPGMLANLGNAYYYRFRHLGERADLDKALEYQTQSVLLTSDHDPGKPRRLNGLGISYLCRFEHIGELEDVDKAVEHESRAVLLSPGDHSELPNLLTHLGNSYMRRFERLLERADIDKAIECHTQATLLIPDDNVERRIQLTNLGLAYQSRFDRLGEQADLDKAIDFTVQAVLLTPDDHTDRPSLLGNLAMSFLSRFNLLGEPVDLDQAIEFQDQAVMLTPDGHAYKSGWLHNLGLAYTRRFKRLGEIPDAKKAIECHNQAVLLTPDGSADKPSRLSSLGDSCMHLFERLGNLPSLEGARSSFQRAAQHIVTHPEMQLNCARRWAVASPLLGFSPQPAYERCMELIPHWIWLGTTIDQRYNLLTKIRDITTEAAAWAISVKSYKLALEWLEEGRSIVWGQILQLRTPFDDLYAVNPILAQRLKNIANELQTAGSRPMTAAALINTTSHTTTSALEKDAQHRRRLAEEWERNVQEARQTPGFHNFMRPRKADELMRAAKDWPVVVINVHHTSCDALILRPNTNDIAHLPLGSFSLEQATRNHGELVSLIENEGVRSRGMRLRPAARPTGLKKILAILWSDITEPILDRLGYKQKLPIDELPRVTWCTTGAISFLPLHAAGRYDGAHPNAPDVVISSYTPTLSALLSTGAQTSGPPHAGLLAIGQAEYSNGLSNLPGTIDELAAVKKFAEKTRYMQLEGCDATVDAVLDAMDKNSWVHLACHAIQNRDNMSHSAFHLRDGSLTLETITKRAFKDKGLAFLSACQTATGDEKLPDEALHLAAGMLMAGYPSVIATMWSIWDIDGPEVAREVYATLLKDGAMDCREAARALHKAVAGLREKLGQDSFKRWVPFIHIGV